ncbi:MAG: hypothetical protein K0S51_491 [Bacillales bacterium]|jgi:hypothetical protein|nr:hypothetical protein [Bacillales bacterium]
MSKSAFIFINNENSTNSKIDNLQDVKNLLKEYIDVNKLTGKQLDWDYEKSSFPYMIKDNELGESWFYLYSDKPGYKMIIVGIAEKETEIIVGNEPQKELSKVIQFVTNDNSTQGDVTKAIELVKFIGKKLKTQVEFSNGRIMFNK